MPSDRLDFSRRAQLPEWMDEPCSYEEFRDCLRDLERVNRVVFAYRPTLRWMKRQTYTLRESGFVGALHVVDVGCGGGDILRRIERWARKQNVAVKLTGIDLNPHAAKVAREFSAASSTIEWITADAFSYHSATPVHCVISSLFTHHLPDEVLVRFLGWMESVAEHGWFINDLRRGPWAYYGFKALATAMRWHRFVRRHDGPISIRRSFRAEDWERFCATAGVGLDSVTIASAFPGRLCVSRIKHG